MEQLLGDVNDNDAHLFAQETDIPELTLDEEQLDIFDDEARALYTGLKRDSIKHARRIVRIVRSLAAHVPTLVRNVTVLMRGFSGWEHSFDAIH